MKRIFLTAVAGAAAIALSSPATAQTVQASPGFVQPDENVLTSTSQTGLQTVIGFTNQTNTSVSVRSDTEDMLSTMASNGQARFEATDGSLDAATIFLTGGGTFAEAEFNLFNALEGTTLVDILINGSVFGQYSVANGENFFGFLAAPGTGFTSIGFDTNGTGVVDLRQVRIGLANSVPAIPEPGTWAMMLLGFGGIGFAMRRNRRATALMQVA
jgi:hypothetical protein